jgi:hypothetical protein
MRKTLRSAMKLSLLVCCLAATAQEKGSWRASSSTAQSITGDIALSNEKITINFSGFPMVRARSLGKPEITAIFDADSNADISGSLYRLNIPASKKFLHHNSLCGAEDTDWMVAYVSGHSLHLAFFSGERPPLLTRDAIANSTDLCGTFSYEG